MNPKDKKRVRDVTRSVKMSYQIAGEEIPSVINEDYRCQVIQVYEIEVANIKEANFISSLYQGIIKPLCIIRIYDSKKETYSFAHKRLSQTEENQIVVNDLYISERYPYGLPGEGISQYIEYMSFDKIKNKSDKLSLYCEWMYKLYLLEHESNFSATESLLKSNSWYSAEHAKNIYQKYVELVHARECAAKAQVNTDKIKANKEVKKAKIALEKEL